MGEVYLARDLRLGREVALKVLPEELSQDTSRLARFEQEARSASALNHPNIVTIYEIGREADTPYIAMELVDGKTLRELCAGGPMPIRKILAASAQVAEGLAKAHGAGIVHRDLKPENLMVSRDGFVKILDFGLAKLTEPESGGASAMPTLARPETHPGTVLGTVGYMSPEQASGQSVDFRSDQFSLGSILYELVTGEKAFARKTAAETMSAIIRDEPEPLERSRPQTPLPLKWIVERCLAKDPDERYASTRDLARDLAGVRDHVSEISSGGEALVAAPPRSRALRAAVVPVFVAAALAAGWIAARALAKPPSAPSFHRLTFRAGVIGNARFAPDGKTVLYGATWEGDGDKASLYQTRADSPESRRFEYPDADILAVSPEGEMAILLGERKDAESTMSRVALAGGAPRPVLEGVPYAGADWAPNGRDLAVIRSVDGKDRLEAPIGTVLFESERNLRSPRFSPSGALIAFFEGPDGRISVSVVEVASRKRRVVSEGWDTVAGAPCWSPGGKEIWFTGSRSGGDPQALFAVSLSGRERLVTRAPGNLELDDISREGRVLAAHHRLRVVVMGRRRGEPNERDLTWFDQSWPTDLSANGNTLVFTEPGEGGGGKQGAVYIRGTDGSAAVRLGEGMSGSLSSEGKWVTARLSGDSGAPPRLVLLPTGAGEPKTVPTSGLDFSGAGNWLPDGQRLLLAAAEKGRPARVFVIDVGSGNRRPVTPEGVGSLRGPSGGNPVAPDGNRFLAADAKGNRFIGYVDGTAPRRLPDLPPLYTATLWAPDGRSLIVRERDSSIRLSRWDFETGEKRPWKEIHPVGFQTGGARLVLMSRDGESYVYQTFGALSDLYLIDGLK
jgi:Tol biopolymer transport system component